MSKKFEVGQTLYSAFVRMHEDEDPHVVVESSEILQIEGTRMTLSEPGLWILRGGTDDRSRCTTTWSNSFAAKNYLHHSEEEAVKALRSQINSRIKVAKRQLIDYNDRLLLVQQHLYSIWSKS